MAMVIRKTLPNPCERCKQVVRPSQDFIRVHLTGAVAYWHFPCWVQQLRERDRRSAETVAEAVR